MIISIISLPKVDEKFTYFTLQGVHFLPIFVNYFDISLSLMLSTLLWVMPLYPT